MGYASSFSLPVNSYISWMNAALNLTDIIIFLLPMPVIYRLHMSLGNRIGLGIIFSMGFFICIITTLRMSTLPQSLHATDPTWQPAPTNMWSFIEAAVGVICAWLISLRKPLQRAGRSVSKLGKVPANAMDTTGAKTLVMVTSYSLE